MVSSLAGIAILSRIERRLHQPARCIFTWGEGNRQLQTPDQRIGSAKTSRQAGKTEKLPPYRRTPSSRPSRQVRVRVQVRMRMRVLAWVLAWVRMRVRVRARARAVVLGFRRRDSEKIAIGINGAPPAARATRNGGEDVTAASRFPSSQACGRLRLPSRERTVTHASPRTGSLRYISGKKRNQRGRFPAPAAPTHARVASARLLAPALPTHAPRDQVAARAEREKGAPSTATPQPERVDSARRPQRARSTSKAKNPSISSETPR